MKKKNGFVLKKVLSISLAILLVMQVSLSGLLSPYFGQKAYASSIPNFISGLSTISSNTNSNYVHSSVQVFGGDTLTFIVLMLGTFTLNSVTASSCSISNQTSTGATVVCASDGFVNPTYNINSGAGPSGGIQIDATSNLYPGENKTITKSATVTTASVPTINTSLSPSTIGHTHTNPHDVSVVAVCNLNSGTFVSFSVASNLDITDEPGAVSGSGTTRNLTFTVRNTSMAPTDISAEITCVNSIGSTTVTRVFSFTNQSPVIDNPNITVPITRGSFSTQVTFSDADPDDDILAGLTATHPDLTAQLFTPGNPATLDLTFDFNNNLVKTVTINNITDDHAFIPSATVVVTIPDDAATLTLDDTDIVSHFGVPPTQLTSAIISANPGTADLGLAFADPNGVDATQAIACSLLDFPTGVSVDTTGAPFTGSGTVSGSPYTSTLTFDPNTFTPGYITVECSMFGGNLVFSDTIEFGAGGRRRNPTIVILLENNQDQLLTAQKNSQDKLAAIAHGSADDTTLSSRRACSETTLLVSPDGLLISGGNQIQGNSFSENVANTVEVSVDAKKSISVSYNSIFSTNTTETGLFHGSASGSNVFGAGFDLGGPFGNPFGSTELDHTASDFSGNKSGTWSLYSNETELDSGNFPGSGTGTWSLFAY